MFTASVSPKRAYTDWNPNMGECPDGIQVLICCLSSHDGDTELNVGVYHKSGGDFLMDGSNPLAEEGFIAVAWAFVPPPPRSVVLKAGE